MDSDIFRWIQIFSDRLRYFSDGLRYFQMDSDVFRYDISEFRIPCLRRTKSEPRFRLHLYEWILSELTNTTTMAKRSSHPQCRLTLTRERTSWHLYMTINHHTQVPGTCHLLRLPWVFFAARFSPFSDTLSCPLFATRAVVVDSTKDLVPPHDNQHAYIAMIKKGTYLIEWIVMLFECVLLFSPFSHTAFFPLFSVHLSRSWLFGS